MGVPTTEAVRLTLSSVISDVAEGGVPTTILPLAALLLARIGVEVATKTWPNEAAWLTMIGVAADDSAVMELAGSGEVSTMISPFEAVELINTREGPKVAKATSSKDGLPTLIGVVSVMTWPVLLTIMGKGVEVSTIS